MNRRILLAFSFGYLVLMLAVTGAFVGIAQSNAERRHILIQRCQVRAQQYKASHTLWMALKNINVHIDTAHSRVRTNAIQAYLDDTDRLAKEDCATP